MHVVIWLWHLTTYIMWPWPINYDLWMSARSSSQRQLESAENGKWCQLLAALCTLLTRWLVSPCIHFGRYCWKHNCDSVYKLCIINLINIVTLWHLIFQFIYMIQYFPSEKNHHDQNFDIIMSMMSVNLNFQCLNKVGLFDKIYKIVVYIPYIYTMHTDKTVEK